MACSSVFLPSGTGYKKILRRLGLFRKYTIHKAAIRSAADSITSKQELLIPIDTLWTAGNQLWSPTDLALLTDSELGDLPPCRLELSRRPRERSETLLELCERRARAQARAGERPVG